MSGASLLSQLCSVDPDVSPPEPVEGPGKAGPLHIAASGLTMAAPFAAPATRFNTSVTADRNVALAQLDLDDIKRVKDRFDVTVNDVVMALCAAVLRWYLQDQGELPRDRQGPCRRTVRGFSMVLRS